jgi:MFS family permease
LLACLFPTDSGSAFVGNGLLVTACIAPLLIQWRFGSLLTPSLVEPSGSRPEAPTGGPDLARAWIARFLIQLGAAFVLGFVFLLVSDRVRADAQWAGGRTANDAVALLSVGATCLGILGAVSGGLLSDRTRARRVPQAVAAATLAASITALGSNLSWPLFFIAYGVFQLALCAFLAINIALVAQLVGDSRRRGALLGLMNLANTIPAVLAPAVVIASLDTRLVQGQLGIFFIAAGLAAAVASAAVLSISKVR